MLERSFLCERFLPTSGLRFEIARGASSQFNDARAIRATLMPSLCSPVSGNAAAVGAPVHAHFSAYQVTDFKIQQDRNSEI